MVARFLVTVLLLLAPLAAQESATAFACRNGMWFDGHAFVAAALDQGAATAGMASAAT